MRYFSILKKGKLRIFWITQTISMIANAFHLIALPLWILAITKSPMQTSLVAFTELLAMIIFSLFSGGIVDILKKKKLLIIGDVIRGILTVLLLFVHSENEIWIVYLTAIGTGMMSSLFGPAQNAIIRQTFNNEELTYSNSIFQLSFSVSLLVGPIIGGTALSYFGYELTFIINAISFFIGAFGSLFIIDQSIGKRRQRNIIYEVLRDLKEGVIFVKTKLNIQKVMITQSVVFFLTGANGFLFITYFNISNVDLSVIGIFMTSQGAGMILGSIIIPKILNLTKRFYLLLGLLITLMGISISIYISLVPHNNVVAIIFILIFGITLSSFNIITSTLLQRESSGDHIGKVTSFSRLVNRSSMAIATALAGTLASIFSIQNIVIIEGIILSIMGLVLVVILGQLFQLRKYSQKTSRLNERP
ncbi:Na+/melibiose symporter [Paenibacillus sophorae]|uniref:MFS transporter n=1 Tax=Paenibacillus sophorae TaxID=1333845 RepID=A0A1H8J0M1_9BACL|nr:MFS transporter [Paenibacillus sophorae]QWU16162.1 MFS transporter [Paenibacillus sophorae]SEN74251.1 Na+/melibiose symporter [Paenibacillus sophorae]